jgi:hypothetical protein
VAGRACRSDIMSCPPGLFANNVKGALVWRAGHDLACLAGSALERWDADRKHVDAREWAANAGAE